MADSGNMGFGSFVPGFDFLQNLAKGAAQNLPQMPSLSSWVAPTLDVGELEKRIADLKAVHFWLEQNGKALAATIQALEVQKMTLATLQGMNFQMGEVADALKAWPGAPAGAGARKTAEAPAAARKSAGGSKAAGSDKATAAGPVDPLQWWTALTEQFQQIAATAMQDVAKATEGTRPPAGEAGPKAPARKAAPRKTRPKK